MAKDRIQASRFEQKYIISEEMAVQIRDYVSSWLELDEHGTGRPNYSYPVHSLYLDSDDLKLYWGTINGDKNRFKLRLRFYDDNPDAPVFLEIKQRMNKCYTKKRAAGRRDGVDQLLAGQKPEPSHLTWQDPEYLSALKGFCELMRALHARPKVHVGYFREAYMPRDDNSARLTMDRQVRGEPELKVQLSTTMLNPTFVWGQDVVLELKFIDRFPDKFRDLVRIFGLRQCGAAKYVDAVATLGEYKLRPPGKS
jgi:hypothetical protein